MRRKKKLTGFVPGAGRRVTFWSKTKIKEKGLQIISLR
jgi:hypothetical protein